MNRFSLLFLQEQLACKERAFSYWMEKETELRKEYGSNPKKHQIAHIRATKARRKQAQDDMKFWSREVEREKNRESLHNLFS